MRTRDRKKTINRQALFNIRFAKFIAELNQTAEEVYRSLDEAIGSGEADTDTETDTETDTDTADENPEERRLQGTTTPPQDAV
jgi:hypothetical protein